MDPTPAEHPPNRIGPPPAHVRVSNDLVESARQAHTKSTRSKSGRPVATHIRDNQKLSPSQEQAARYQEVGLQQGSISPRTRKSGLNQAPTPTRKIAPQPNATSPKTRKSGLNHAQSAHEPGSRASTTLNQPTNQEVGPQPRSISPRTRKSGLNRARPAQKPGNRATTERDQPTNQEVGPPPSSTSPQTRKLGQCARPQTRKLGHQRARKQ
jgi:hypothetical protein